MHLDTKLVSQIWEGSKKKMFPAVCRVVRKETYNTKNVRISPTKHAQHREHLFLLLQWMCQENSRVENVQNQYRIHEFDDLSLIFNKRIKDFYLSSILERVEEYFKQVKWFTNQQKILICYKNK